MANQPNPMAAHWLE